MFTWTSCFLLAKHVFFFTISITELLLLYESLIDLSKSLQNVSSFLSNLYSWEYNYIFFYSTTASQFFYFPGLKSIEFNSSKHQSCSSPQFNIEFFRLSFFYDKHILFFTLVPDLVEVKSALYVFFLTFNFFFSSNYSNTFKLFLWSKSMLTTFLSVTCGLRELGDFNSIFLQVKHPTPAVGVFKMPIGLTIFTFIILKEFLKFSLLLFIEYKQYVNFDLLFKIDSIMTLLFQFFDLSLQNRWAFSLYYFLSFFPSPTSVFYELSMSFLKLKRLCLRCKSSSLGFRGLCEVTDKVYDFIQDSDNVFEYQSHVRVYWPKYFLISADLSQFSRSSLPFLQQLSSNYRELQK